MNESLVSHINSLDISAELEIPTLEAVGEVKQIAREDMQAAIDGGSLVSFVAGLTPAEKDDVLYSTQFAQRAASAKIDRFGFVRQWYEVYNNTLETLGWVTEQFAFTHYAEDEGEIHMDSAAIKVLASIASGGQLTTLQGALKALQELSEGSDEFTVLEMNGTNEFGGNFQIGSAQRTENGAVSLVIGAFYFKAVNQQRRFLFFRWGKKNINFWTAAQKMTLNDGFYGAVRDVVKEKLGQGREDAIRGIELA